MGRRPELSRVGRNRGAEAGVRKPRAAGQEERQRVRGLAEGARSQGGVLSGAAWEKLKLDRQKVGEK